MAQTVRVIPSTNANRAVLVEFFKQYAKARHSKRWSFRQPKSGHLPGGWAKYSGSAIKTVLRWIKESQITPNSDEYLASCPKERHPRIRRIMVFCKPKNAKTLDIDSTLPKNSSDCILHKVALPEIITIILFEPQQKKDEQEI